MSHKAIETKSISSSISSGIASIPFKRYSSCHDAPFVKGKLIGKGNNANVYSACKKHAGSGREREEKKDKELKEDKEEDCQYAMKEVNFNVRSSGPGRYISNRIEAAILEKLQGETWIDTQGRVQVLVPKFYGGYLCKDDSAEVLKIVTEKWENDMEYKGRKRAVELGLADKKQLTEPNDSDLYQRYRQDRPVLAYTVNELENMNRLAARLDELGVIHGDLSPAQILYQTSVTGETNFAVTDFAELGNYGWMEGMYDCQGRVFPSIRPYFNRLQLLSYLTDNADTIVVPSSLSSSASSSPASLSSSHRSNKKSYDKFVSFSDSPKIPSSIYDDLRLVCPKYPNPRLDALKSTLSPLDRRDLYEPAYKTTFDEDNKEFENLLLQYINEY